MEWEIANGFATDDPTDCGQDTDADGLTNLQESIEGTDPRKKDSDNDWIRDGLEVVNFNTDPLKADTDDDGIICTGDGDFSMFLPG